MVNKTLHMANLSGIRRESYFWNKKEQKREYDFLMQVAEIKGIDVQYLPDPLATKISVKNWDKIQEKVLAELNLPKVRYWQIIENGDTMTDYLCNLKLAFDGQ